MADSEALFVFRFLGCSWGMMACQNKKKKQKNTGARLTDFSDAVQVSKFKHRKEVLRKLVILRDSGLGH